MRIDLRSVRFGTALLVAALVAFSGPTSAFAEDPIASDVDVSEVSDYVGVWKIGFDVMGNIIELFLTIADVDGKVGATLDSERQPEALAITTIALAEEAEGLTMSSELTFGGSFKIDINLNVHMEGDTLAGDISDKGGIFKGTFEGEKMTQEDLDSVQGRRPAPTEARLTVDGKRVRIAFANLKTDSVDWETFENLKEGEVFQFTTSRATKIYTDLDLGFGDVVIKKENMGPNYPGVYSLWLKRVGDGWHLVFNSQSDIWGTRYHAEYDVAEIPLAFSTADGEPVEKFVVTLEQEGDNEAIMTIRWGTAQWTATAALIQ